MSTSTLSNGLHENPIRKCTKQDIIRYLWVPEHNAKTRKSELDWEPYFVYYQDQCAAAMHEQGKHLLIRTHQQIIDIARNFDHGRSLMEIRSDLKRLFTGKSELPDEDEIVVNSVDLVARLHFMVNVGTYRSTVTQGTRILWNARTAHQFLKDTFQESHEPSGPNIRFESGFNALDLQRVADITIHWTDNLADHLRLVEDDRVVAIFHHATFLRRQNSNTLYPEGLIEETIRTLALLFPKHDKEVVKWLRSAHAVSTIDGYLMHCDPLRLEDRQIQNFKFWKHRLVILKQAFDESRPIKIRQWWFDRRDGYAWYTFWVALFVLFLTVFFGVIQSIEGALQVYKAYHPSG